MFWELVYAMHLWQDLLFRIENDYISKFIVQLFELGHLD